ncbi:MAG: acylphosphatase [Spirochaetes bacterium]|nr:MAG: acylphosphatase [Spirochaetota bacterium]
MNQQSRQNSNKEAFYARVHGRVQGVGFRYSVRLTARRYGIKGWVRNEMDGSVSVMCEGDKENLKLLEKWLEQGPPGAYVIKVEKRKLPFKGEFTDFSIRF